jgi:hypothetical protein
MTDIAWLPIVELYFFVGMLRATFAITTISTYGATDHNIVTIIHRRFISFTNIFYISYIDEKNKCLI